MIFPLLMTFAGCCCVLGQQARHDPLYLQLAGLMNLEVTQEKILFNFPNAENGAVLKGELGVSLDKEFKMPKICDDNQDSKNCLQFSSDLKLTTKRKEKCLHLNWTSSSNTTLEDCFSYGDDFWYGGPENSKQYWPFNNMTYKDFSYVTKAEEAQAVAEPYWVTSSGYYIFVDRSVPLFIDTNHHQSKGLCLIAKQKDPYLPRSELTLSYKVCTYENARKAHKSAVKNDLGHATDMPDKRMVRHPIWSTWVRYKAHINEAKVLSFAEEIVSNGFNNSQLEIDDRWETCYGSGEFDTSRFPNMTNLSSTLKDMGFRVTLWNHPFVNYDCPLYKTLKEKGYLVKSENGCILSYWWDGIGGVVDFTNSEAADWFVNYRIDMMKENNIDSVKLDAGESSWLPQIPVLNASVTEQPDVATAAYARTVARFGSMMEVRVGYGTQDLPIFVRMLDKDSRWSFKNGLPTLLTTLLQMNMNGYTFVLPDMVGGNAYDFDVISKELFIRWLQATTFMPVIQFSTAPWDFDDETVAISKKFTSLHFEYSDEIISQMKKSVKSGAPVNMPLWWVAPTDKEAQPIWSEYLMGEDILVAPVVEEGAVTRDIYLPEGRWRDEADSKHKVYKGKRWIRNYSAPLDTLPYFTRVGKKTGLDDDY